MPGARNLSVFELDPKKLEGMLGRKVEDRRLLTLEELWRLYLGCPLLDLNRSIEHIMTARTN